MQSSPIGVLALFLLPAQLGLPAPSAAPLAARTQPASPQAISQDSLFAEVSALLEQGVANGSYRGVVAVVESEGERLMQVVLGLQNQAGQVAMQIDTIFRIYSMTKPVTVVAALMLMEAGSLELDDPVSKHLPQFLGLKVGVERAALQREMTVRDLMRHTSGLTYGIFADSSIDSMVREADLLNPKRSSKEMLDKLAEIPLKRQPGSRFEYSLSIDVLGALVEVLSEQSLASFMQERIFLPLGMQDTGFFVPASKVARLADLNSRVAGELQPFPETPSLTELPNLQSGGGGLFSTMDDYLRFASMLLHGGEHEGKRLLSPKSVAMMTSNQMASIDARGAFGLGGALVLKERGSGPGLHTYSWGGLAGTDFWMDPSERIVGVFMLQCMGENQHSEVFKRSVYRAIGR